MRSFLLSMFFGLLTCTSNAQPYGHYDPVQLLKITETPSGKQYSIKGEYLDQILNDLSAHAKNYPPRFDTPQDQKRAIQDVKTFSGMLDIVTNGPTPNQELLVRAGQLNSLGHNLDIEGAAAKANAIFQKLLAASPADPRGNYLYGTFLAGIGKPKDALTFLDKALALGVADAAYALGMTHLALGDKTQALKNFENYQLRNPKDPSINQLIDAIRNGKLELKTTPS